LSAEQVFSSILLENIKITAQAYIVFFSLFTALNLAVALLDRRFGQHSDSLPGAAAAKPPWLPWARAKLSGMCGS
jgi:hypothetical protein